MTEITFGTLLLLNAGTIALCIIGLLISRQLNSVLLFRSMSILCSLIALYMPVFLKFHSPWSLSNTNLAILAAGSGFLFAMKVLELAFGQEWTNIQKMTPKQIAIMFSSFPQTSKSAIEHSQGARRHSIFMILQAVVELIALRILLHFTPLEWVSLPLTSLPLLHWPLRYGVLGTILYLVLTMVTNFVFGIGGFLWNARMNSVFPLAPYLSTSLRDFWSRRWNAYVKASLHSMSFDVAPKLIGASKTMSKGTSGFVAFTLSAIFHEFLFKMANDRWSGKNTVFFLTHAVLMRLEIASKFLEKPMNPMMKLVGWGWTMGVLLFTAPLFFDPWIEANYFVSLKQTLG